MYKILVCDDDKAIAGAISILLKNEGYQMFEAYNGQEAIDIIKEHPDIHLVILDVMMPVKDGISSIVEIRKFHNMPIIFLSAKSEDTDKILGLNFGADDYITKPYNPLELIARVKSQIRRYASLGSMQSTDSVLKTGGLVVNINEKWVSVDDEKVALTATEFNILAFLMCNMNRVFSIDDIYEAVWKEDSFGSNHTVAVHIRRIREKIEIDPKNPKYLKVVWGIGYKIEKI